MKIFLVDIMSCLELPHHETFFFKDVKERRIALFNQSLSSLDKLTLVRDWLTEEVNRNPFSIDNGIVLFFIPRDLTGRRVPTDYEIYVKLCIHELVLKYLDKRFRFFCYFLDKTDRNAGEDSEYRRIEQVCKDFASDNTDLRYSFLPLSFIPQTDNAAETEERIDLLGDATAKQFYLNALERVRNTDMPTDAMTHEAWYRTRFLGHCAETVAEISDFHVSYFSGDVSIKRDLLLKTVEYICSFAEHYDPRNDFDIQFKDFFTYKSFSEFNPDFDNIMLRIAVLKRRLSNWTVPDPPEEESPEPYVYKTTKHYKELEKEIQKITEEELTKVMNRALKGRSLKKMCASDFTSNTMNSLKKLLTDANRLLKAFCGDRVRDFAFFLQQHNPAVIYRKNDSILTESEKEAERELAEHMNKYSVNELPGFSEELKIQQELDLIEKKIEKTGACLEWMKFLPFLVTLLFALSTVGLYYYGVQNSVFTKENTLYVFVLYLVAAAVLFALTFFSVRAYYRRKVRNLFKKCMSLAEGYLQSFVAKAKEFETNICSAMNYYCRVEQNNRLTQNRQAAREYNGKILWHKLKIAEILENLKYFDGYIPRDELPEETSVPKLDPFEDDAMHSEFYQMRIF